MTGIKLKISDDGEVGISHDEPEHECFGGFMCRNLKISEEGFWHCNHSQQPVSRHYELGQCPQGHWVKLAVPIGAQNLTREERYRWYENSLEKSSPEPGEELPDWGLK